MLFSNLRRLRVVAHIQPIAMLQPSRPVGCADCPTHCAPTGRLPTDPDYVVIGLRASPVPRTLHASCLKPGCTPSAPWLVMSSVYIDPTLPACSTLRVSLAHPDPPGRTPSPCLRTTTRRPCFAADRSPHLPAHRVMSRRLRPSYVGSQASRQPLRIPKCPSAPSAVCHATCLKPGSAPTAASSPAPPFPVSSPAHPPHPIPPRCSHFLLEARKCANAPSGTASRSTRSPPPSIQRPPRPPVALLIFF